jgi:signal transduction histidine kinase
MLIIFSGLLALVVLAAAVLLYRWIDRVSDADRLQQREILEVAFRGFQSEFSGAIQEIFSTFRPQTGFQNEAELEAHLAELFSQWQNNSRQPQLIGSLGIGTIDLKGAVTFESFLPQEKRFQKQDWPAGLQNYRDILTQRWSERALPAGLSGGFTLSISADRPVIVIPTTFFRPPMPHRRSDWRQNPSAARRGPGPPDDRPLLTDRSPSIPNHPSPSEDNSAEVMGWYFIELDAPFLKQQFLPNLAERHFGGPILSRYRLAVLAGKPGHLIYASDPGLTLESFNNVDMTAPLFRPQGRFGFGFRPRGGGMPPPDLMPGDVLSESRIPFNPASREGSSVPAGNSWQLLARHRLGSIEVEVNKTRYRNLAIGFGILLLMTGSILTLMLSTQRARALARQQMEFVAGVSHELRTPLSVIQSAGFNLSHGVAVQTEKIQQYGAVIQTESRRLSDMLEQILNYAGIQSGREHYQFQLTEIRPFLQKLLMEYRKPFEEGGWTVEQQIDEDLPPVLADVRTLESAIRNLLENALKYAATGKWLRLTAVTAHNRKEVVVTVADRGPGIDPADLPHIFEPFYRGKKVLASSIPGAGLGLSLLQRYLKAHGGSVRLVNLPGGGTSFTLYLPVFSE